MFLLPSGGGAGGEVGQGEGAAGARVWRRLGNAFRRGGGAGGGVGSRRPCLEEGECRARSVLPACRWPRLEVGKYRSGEGSIGVPRRRRSVVASPCISLSCLPSAPVRLSAAAGTCADGGGRKANQNSCPPIGRSISVYYGGE